ncbi:OLC1v1036157C1 [Oldenlandia corymbosa var. corymbosa]|uniref:Large ribosomal subunit protein bL21m n=1 Tax=Oldenlandia corymbosa var. corymbosa TaxID=529605 RepID=A0AAV1CVB2_OLDCO|nr:OLC1v1036157C1 [Oldenlandia corymbosa var. corymbosa]
MANRRCFQTLVTRYLPHISSHPQTAFLHPISRLVRTQFDGIPNLNPSETSISIPSKFPSTFSSFSRHFCSNYRGNDGEEKEEEDDDDDDDDYEGSDVADNEIEDEERGNVSGKSDEQKAQEAEEIGYKVLGPLQKSDRVFKPYEPVFAVIQIGSHQFKVSNGDSIFVEKLKYCDVNDKLILNKVLMLGSKAQTIIGRPVVPDAVVHAVVEEHALDAKVLIFKKKRRKNYRRTKGHRQVS